MNKQSNTYTIIYIAALVIIVGTAMAIASLALKPAQKANADADKMKQILSSINVTTDGDIQSTFEKYIKNQYVVDSSGESIKEGIKAFDVRVAEESKKDASERLLPVYEAAADDGTTKYILPVYGQGLWGPIWGYIALNDDFDTVYGAYFSHESETPGLGAEIAKPEFSARFAGKHLYKDNEFKSIAVVKAGRQSLNGEDYVDGVSGGTITSKGVETMLNKSLSAYQGFFNFKKNQCQTN